MIKRILSAIAKLFSRPAEMVPRCVYPLPGLPDGRLGLITSRGHWANKSRPKHKGDDWMYRRADPSEPGRHKKYTVPAGTQAIAIKGGVVVVAGRIRTGLRCWILHEDGYRSGYFHLSQLAVAKNQTVKAGEAVGTIGHNPEDGSELDHLHFEVSTRGAYAPVDPWSYLQASGAVHLVRHEKGSK